MGSGCSNPATLYSDLSGDQVPLPRRCRVYRARPSNDWATTYVKGGTHSLFAPDGAFGALSPVEQDQLKDKAKALAEVFQRSSSNVEGRNGYLSLRNHQLRGLDHPRKRACLTPIHNFFLTRTDGTTAGERFRAEASVDVCGDPGIRGDTACTPQSTATSRGVDQRAQGGQRHDQGRRHDKKILWTPC